ncbi:uncharacterized protein LOC143857602 [Tasmannia lanceolata]|uniref:uncharacterized protein LOC143857602 n=1 Tax=Tasmannia lanceolata TaxID=3420 RepID=UPI0040636965
MPLTSLFTPSSTTLPCTHKGKMLKLSRSSFSAILRTSGVRYRFLAPPILSSHYLFPSRRYSVLTAGKRNASCSVRHPSIRCGVLFGNYYDSTAAAADVSNLPAEKYEYQAEVSRLMDLIVHSLYSNKEVFLRELVSNASDALGKLEFLSVTEPELLKDTFDLHIRIQTDKDNGVITISDTGIGMTRQELVDCLGAIAQSGTAKFLKAMKDCKDAGSDNNLIGQFGVGFFSAFLVSDRVVVSTKSPKSDKQYVWEGEANAGSYTIREETNPEKLIPRGTCLTLYLKSEDKGFAHPESIQNLVKNYSQFVSFPIYTSQEKGFTEEVEADEDYSVPQSLWDDAQELAKNDVNFVPPPPGFVKLNFAGSSLGNPGPARIGGLVRNDKRELIWAFSRPIGVADLTEAEVRAAHYGIKYLASNNFENVMIEGSSLNVIKWLQGDEKHPSTFDKFFDEIDNYRRSSASPFKNVQSSANETKPIWLLNPKAVTTEEYNEFYKKTFNEYLDPLASSHFTAEGEVELRSILFVPATAPMGREDVINPKTENIRLYVKCLFISDDFDGMLFPRYLRFVKGVVDSNDLPLNVSDEILQESGIVQIMKKISVMKKILVHKALDMILRISVSENKDDYEKFWVNFGKNLKLGCIEDNENQKRIAPLLRFFSSHSEEELISLDEYVERMKTEQKDIYYIASDNLKSARNTPFLETLLEKDSEVLFLIDPIDEVAIQNLKTYKEKNFVDIRKENLDLGDKNEENQLKSEVVEPFEAGEFQRRDFQIQAEYEHWKNNWSMFSSSTLHRRHDISLDRPSVVVVCIAGPVVAEIGKIFLNHVSSGFCLEKAYEGEVFIGNKLFNISPSLPRAETSNIPGSHPDREAEKIIFPLVINIPKTSSQITFLKPHLKGKMQKLWRSSVSAILRTGGVRYRFLTPPILSSHVSRDDKGFAHPERIQNLVKNYSQFVSFSTWQEKGFTEEEKEEEIVMVVRDIHLERDDKGFAHPERIQNLVNNYSQFVSFTTWQEKGFTTEVKADEDHSVSQSLWHGALEKAKNDLDWVPPPPGFLSLCFSGCSSCNPGLAGIGGLLRDYKREVIWAFSGSIGVADTTEAEVRAAHYAMKFLASNNFKNLIIQGSSLNVIKWLNGDEKHPSRFDKFFDEIVDFKRSMDSPFKKDVRRSANETEPIWLLNPKAATTEEYNEFYKKTFNECLDPLASSHFTTEGEVELRSILFVPATAPMGREYVINPKTKNIRLYVKRVFISDDFDGELFPRYLSFVKGVVDSNDLPLYVSREILQESRIVRIMRKIFARKAFDMIFGISMSGNKDDYEKFWENFGKNLKLGCIEDNENQNRIAPLLRFFSSHSEEELFSLDEYVERMKPDQKDIYYIASDNLKSARNTPFLERLLEKDFEVLFLIDPIDEVAIQNLKTYKEKNFVDISKEDLDLGDENEENPVEAGGSK